MNTEFKNFIKVWISAIICIIYCYYVSSRIKKGVLRFFSLVPVFSLFIILPFTLTSVHLGGVTAFLLVWLISFKLALFAFDQGPLSPPQPKLFHFICIACLPIKVNQTGTYSKLNPESPSFKSILFAIKVVLLAFVFRVYEYQDLLHKNTISAIYCLHLYLETEIVLAICAIPARFLYGFEIEPQFNEPYLSSSIQDFWGRRWNLMVSGILRLAVYNPIRSVSGRIAGPRWASVPAILMTFLVSGLMHELLYYYATLVPPTWEVTWFFILQGFVLAIEIVVKKMVVKDKWRLHRVVSALLTDMFVAVTAVWLFFPQLLRHNVFERATSEYSLVIDLFKSWLPLKI